MTVLMNALSIIQEVNIMTKEQVQEYYRNYNALHNGHITEEQWKNYCNDFLYDIMEQNKDVLERLKDR